MIYLVWVDWNSIDHLIGSWYSTVGLLTTLIVNLIFLRRVLFFLFVYSLQLDLIFQKFWYIAKYYAYKNCKYNLKDLHKTVLKALDLVMVSTIFHYYKYYIEIIDTYHFELKCKTKQFTIIIYDSHR